jgi:hypothetical protein
LGQLFPFQPISPFTTVRPVFLPRTRVNGWDPWHRSPPRAVFSRWRVGHPGRRPWIRVQDLPTTAARAHSARILLFLRRANRTSSVMAQFAGSVGVIRKPASGGHKKGGAGSLPPHFLHQRANNLNRTDLHYRRKNRENRDPPPSFSRLNVVRTLACDQDFDRGQLLKLAVASPDEVTQQCATNFSPLGERRRGPPVAVVSSSAHTNPCEYPILWITRFSTSHSRPRSEESHS